MMGLATERGQRVVHLCRIPPLLRQTSRQSARKAKSDGAQVYRSGSLVRGPAEPSLRAVLGAYSNATQML